MAYYYVELEYHGFNMVSALTVRKRGSLFLVVTDMGGHMYTKNSIGTAQPKNPLGYAEYQGQTESFRIHH